MSNQGRYIKVVHKFMFMSCARTHVIYMETRLPRIVFDRKGHTIDEMLCIPTYILILLLYMYLRLNHIHTKYIIKVPIIITN